MGFWFVCGERVLQHPTANLKKTNVKGRITFNMCSYVPVETEQTVCQGTTDEAERLVKLGFHHEAPRCPC